MPSYAQTMIGALKSIIDPVANAQDNITIENINKLSVMGFIEVIKHLPFFKKLMNKVLEKINKMKPDHIILIDYPGFNLRLAKQIKIRFNN